MAKRKLGHITDEENRKALKAVQRAKENCEKEYKPADPRVYTCRVGADLVREELNKLGFLIPFGERELKGRRR